MAFEREPLPRASARVVEMSIPTYGVGEPDRNPMFLEKRVYQGSSGKVYPFPVIDRIEDEARPRVWKVVVLENRWLEVWVMPELGGRVQRALDKTNGYDFVYYNHVIKPALVGLAGPWISGGIEFNWPQHHRPSTFSPVEYEVAEGEDGSACVHLAEIDRMNGTRAGMTLRLRKDRAYLEVEGRLYNGTPEPQTFLWWANPAFAVNENTRSIFPPDVVAVMDHGKRDTSRFPIATGTYYKVDYSAGVDISRYKNIPVPTSYMAASSAYDFVGGYDDGKGAGLLHVAEHRVAPGKKQWTWGSGDFGKAWDRNLTDEDGPYVELMTGVFTDNQPDFSWLSPFEEKRFTQYFMPYKALGAVKNATAEAALGLEVVGDRAEVGAYVTGPRDGLSLTLRAAARTYLDVRLDLSPEKAYLSSVELPPGLDPYALELALRDSEGRLLVSYRPEPARESPLPEAAKPLPPPRDLPSAEALFLAGRHLEQYRHATLLPEDYYREGLARDPGDIRLNNAYGLLLLRKGLFSEAEPYFRAAIARATSHNPNPYDGEPFFNLGTALLYAGRREEAYDAFYKATWSSAWQHAGFLALARMATAGKNREKALYFVEESLARNLRDMKARQLKAILLRILGRDAEARSLAEESLRLDPLDHGALSELFLLDREGEDTSSSPSRERLLFALRGSEFNFLALSADYADAGLLEEAILILGLALESEGLSNRPLLLYRVARLRDLMGEEAEAVRLRALSMAAPTDYAFPNTIEDLLALEAALTVDPSDGKAAYYLGDYWYDRREYERAIVLWEKAARLLPAFPTVRRNLAIARFNKQGDAEGAKLLLEEALALDPGDARLLLELDQLKKKRRLRPIERLRGLDAFPSLVARRDDLAIERATLLNLLGRHREALDLILARRFHPWEGGEGRPTRQYVLALLGLGRQALAKADARTAVELFETAEKLPQSLGEGKLAGAQENDRFYYLGRALASLGDSGKAREAWLKASVGIYEPASAMFYNDQPPESIFFQGLALCKLGDSAGARSRFNRLVDYGERHLFDVPSIDYFAVSLPDFLIFDEDLGRRNAFHCRYLAALGRLGLAVESRGPRAGSLAAISALLEEDPGHQGCVELLAMASDPEL